MVHINWESEQLEQEHIPGRTLAWKHAGNAWKGLVCLLVAGRVRQEIWGSILMLQLGIYDVWVAPAFVDKC